MSHLILAPHKTKMDEIRGGSSTKEKANRLKATERVRIYRKKKEKQLKSAESSRRSRQKITGEKKRGKRNAGTLERTRQYRRRKFLSEQQNTTTSLASIESESSVSESPPSESDVISNLIEKLESTVLLPDNFEQKLQKLEANAKKQYQDSTAVDDSNEIHKAPVCVVCDEFIIKLDDIQGRSHPR